MRKQTILIFWFVTDLVSARYGLQHEDRWLIYSTHMPEDVGPGVPHVLPTNSIRWIFPASFPNDNSVPVQLLY